MPTYEYRCDTCPITITIVRGINDTEHKPTCINCSKVMTRIYDKPRITLKGNDWGGGSRSV